MSEHDKADRRNVSGKGQSKRVGTSVLVAAASLLGTSLGVSATTPAESEGVQDSTGQNAIEVRPVEQRTLLAGNLTNVIQSPRLSVKPPNQVHLKSNQDKDFSTNQFKSYHSKDKDFTISDQFKSNHLKSNQFKE